MAHKSIFIEALDRSEAKRDGGYRQNWSFSLSGDCEEQRRHDPPVTMDEAGGPQELSPEGLKSPPLKPFAETQRTYERRPNHPNHFRALNKMGANKMLSESPLSVAAMQQTPNRTNYFNHSPSLSQGVVVQGRLFQHAQTPSAVRKPTQRNDYNTQSIQRVDIESIVLTCPDISDADEINIKRRTQQKRRPLLEPMGSFSSPTQTVEPVLDPHEYFSVCGKCNQPSEDHTKCQNCGSALPVETVLSHHQHSSQVTTTSPSLAPHARPPIRSSQPSLSPALSSGSHSSLSLGTKNFYGAAAGGLHSPHVDMVMNPPARITRGNLLIPHNGGRACAGLAGSTAAASTSYQAKFSNCKRHSLTKPHELNDPIVLSSDEEEEEEEEEADNASTGSVNRLDSVSPRPADSAHSSPAPSGGKVEAAVKGPAEQQDELTVDYFTEINDSRITLPRKPRMKDPYGNPVCEDHSTPKRRKVIAPKLESIILECRSVRIGTLRRMVTKPVIFSSEYIQLETESREVDVMEKVRLRASELTSCEWCNVRKLPVLFFQTSANECQRLRQQLHMSQESGGLWYDCTGNNTPVHLLSRSDLDEKYIVLIFENGLSMHEQMILEEILVEIGRTNALQDFPSKLTFSEANVRLVQYNKAAKEKEKVKVQETAQKTAAAPATTSPTPTATPAPTTTSPSPSSPVPPPPPPPAPVRTRMATRLHACFEDEDEDDMELQPTFTGPVVKLMVYPPPPAKGGISVTNEDLHCLNDGEFLNDVIIDFYLKYLFLERLKKDDAGRSHVFSSFFYKRLNQRERRNVTDTANLPIQKRKHNRVKTWTRHVDLFQKDFIFVPINESAHWYLAVICFPGLEGPKLEPNPSYQPQSQTTGAVSRGSPALERDHHSSAREAPTSAPATPSPPLSTAPVACPAGPAAANHQHKAVPVCRHLAQDTNCSPGINGQLKVQPQYSDGLHRISVSYGSGNRHDDAFVFSDERSSSPDECSEDGALAEDVFNSESMEWTSKPTICKQPCILIMDSLRGPARSTVVKTLREYLEVEWEVRKGTQRSFGKDVMKGSSPRVPQQDNFSDCGVYVLQYVESFFETPIPSFHLPMNLSDWFAQQRMKRKRDEIKELILKLQSQQQAEGISPGLTADDEADEEDADGLDVQDIPVTS
ncbi:sentrin-specific protease 6 isoform X2 [Clupea harengus]|uniref:Sentrin-specific protease 6 n=1 Tax=Clupea harengus TaxID=7950 RepID=A0A6P8GI02_CLUHA|nr:sentrin-specific protease 6 isoform X2 [Clupea harengus]